MSVAVRTLRLTCSAFYVDARLTSVEGRWLASADTPDGPSIGTGGTLVDALIHALQHFEDAIDELLACRLGHCFLWQEGQPRAAPDCQPVHRFLGANLVHL